MFKMMFQRSLLIALVGVCSLQSGTFARQLFDAEAEQIERHSDIVNERPLIGILSQPDEPAPKGYSYIAASYVKFVESAGARVVPIEYDLPSDEVRERFKSINGVLIPGGSQFLHPGHKFYDTSKLLFDLTIEANDNGIYFPLHATCLGFETLAVIASSNTSILGPFSAEDYPSPLYFTEEAEKSRFFGSWSASVRDNVQKKNYAMENHGEGVTFESYDENQSMRDFFKVLSLTADRDGKIYISTMEARNYPITGTQWHPEKNAFEWAPHLHIPHHPEAIEVTAAVAKFFVNEARKNSQQPANHVDEDNLLIYNFPAEFTGKHHYEGEEADFDESYFFPIRSRRTDEPATASS